MPGFQAFTADELTTGASGKSGPYSEILRRPGFSMGVYQIPWAAPIISTRTTPTRSTSCSAARRHCGSRIRTTRSAPARSSR